MTESEIESLINKIVLFQKEYDKNKDSEIKRDIEKAKEQLMKICENIHKSLPQILHFCYYKNSY